MGMVICAQCGFANAETCQLCVACTAPAASPQEAPSASPYFANDPDGPAYRNIIAATPPLPSYQPPPVITPIAKTQNLPLLSLYVPPAKVAGRSERFLAWLIDSLGFYGAIIISGVVDELFGPDLSANAWVLWFIFLSYFSVQTYLLTVHGQTLGKRALGLRIVKADTRDNGGFVTNVLLRSLAPLLLGGISCHLFTLIDYLAIFGDDRKCIHDNMAGTIVIKWSATP